MGGRKAAGSWQLATGVHAAVKGASVFYGLARSKVADVLLRPVPGRSAPFPRCCCAIPGSSAPPQAALPHRKLGPIGSP
eukprot:55096-Chlamydomonas_euryale.AAC.2